MLNIPYRLVWFRHGDWSDRSKPVLVLIHGIGTSSGIWSGLIKQLPSTPILAVDLLGFGESKKPDWSKYSLNDHVRSLKKTIRQVAKGRDIILCGHSLGSLISIRYTHLNPSRVKRLFLCSPPIYDFGKGGKFPSKDDVLAQVGQKFLEAIESSPKNIKAANAYKMYQRSFHIDPDNPSPFIKTARNSILGQGSFEELSDMHLPASIVYGTLDTVMVPGVFKRIRKINPLISIHTVAAGHEMNSQYIKRLKGILISEATELKLSDK